MQQQGGERFWTPARILFPLTPRLNALLDVAVFGLIHQTSCTHDDSTTCAAAPPIQRLKSVPLDELRRQWLEHAASYVVSSESASAMKTRKWVICISIDLFHCL